MYLNLHEFSWLIIMVCIQGILKGFDQATNIILDESHERVYSTKVCLVFAQL